MSDEIDLRIFRTMISERSKGVEFALTYDHDMFSPNYQLVAKICIEYLRKYRENPTKRTLSEFAGRSYKPRIEEVWGKAEEIDYSDKEFVFDLNKLKSRYEQFIIKKISDISANPGENAERDIKLLLQKLKTVKDGRKFIQKTVSEGLDQASHDYDLKKKNPKSNKKIPCGFSAIDFAMSGGLAPGELFVVGGETGSGKSMFLLNMAIQMWLQGNSIDTPPDEMIEGKNVTYYSLEMPWEECFGRLIARLAQVPEEDYSNGDLNIDQEMRVDKVKAFIEKYHWQFEIVDMPRGMTPDELELRHEDANLKYEPHVVAVDYLTLMNLPSNEQDWLKMGTLAGALHEFARANKVIALSGVQLNDVQRGEKKDIKKKGEKGVLVGGHRIGRSSQMLHHINAFVQIETRPDEDMYGDFKFHYIKNRRGPKPQNCTLKKNFTNSTLTDIPYVYKKQEGSDNYAYNDDQDDNLNSDISESFKKVKVKIDKDEQESK